MQANTFQAVIAADQQKTFVFFIYGDIQWSDFPLIGFFPEDGPMYQVPDSLTNQALSIDEGSNVNVTGVYIYRVDCSVYGPNNDGEKLQCYLLLGKFAGQVLVLRAVNKGIQVHVHEENSTSQV